MTELSQQHSLLQEEKFKKRPMAAEPSGTRFAGRLGGNQAFVADPKDASEHDLLKREPDAAPGMSLREQFNLHQFTDLGLWRAAFVECVGTMLLVFVTVFTNTSPNVLPMPPTAQLGPFDNAYFFGPTTGGISNFILLSLCIFAFAPVSGGHLNPVITTTTFVARLCTLPRLILYIVFQVLGATIAGYMVRAGYGNRDFKVGGCYLFTQEMPVGEAFVMEFAMCLGLVFIAFGVGLDPRQRAVIPPSLSPFLVGLTLGVLGWASAYARFGYGGASMNPARCFGAFVGSRFPYWHWIHWVADLAACAFFGFFYHLVPPVKVSAA